MNNKSTFIKRHLSALIFSTLYFILIFFHLLFDGFILFYQVELLITMVPFILLGIILDYILTKDTNIHKNYKTFAQILPSGIIILIISSLLLDFFDQSIPELFLYLYWIFLSLPFFISSYNKEYHKKRMTYSILGVLVLAAIYLHLASQTFLINDSSGAVIYFLSYFFMLYSSSTINRLPFISLILAIINSVILIIMRYAPFASSTAIHGWDYNIVFQLEILMLLTFITCILIRLFVAILNTKRA